MPKPATSTPRSTARKKPARSAARVKRVPKKQQRSIGDLARSGLWVAIELTGLFLTAALATVVILGYASAWFSGSGLFSHLLPFIVGVLVLATVLVVFGWLWWKFRQPLQSLAAFLPALLLGGLALSATWSVAKGDMAPAFRQFRMLVGGKEAVRRNTLAHQVYASYRRYGAGSLQQMVDRSARYRRDVEEAADIFDIDPDLLLGVAAVESSFKPRDSRDGGHGLFQLTRVPQAAMDEAGERLDVSNPSVRNDRHNAFIAAATFKHYLQQMNDDLFLALLAYNIGPRNGGLRFIMDRYGVRDFVTIQPYLKELPRDYPIRVLSYALAFRVWRDQGRVLAYEQAGNAQSIQGIGIPGLPDKIF